MSIVEQAKAELALAGWDQAEIADMAEVLTCYFSHFDSGGAVAATFSVLMRLIAGKPLSPLTGEDSEWNDVSEMMSQPCWQNKRCSSVFKRPDGTAHDLDTPEIQNIIFPYMPVDAKVRFPVFEIKPKE